MSDPIDRSDRLVAALFVVLAASAVGMLADVWTLVYYSVPALTYLFMLMGCLSQSDRWAPRVVAVTSAFGAALLLLFLWAGMTLESSTYHWGLPLPTAIMVFMVWPFTTVVTPLIYAWVYQTWLRPEVELVAD